MKPISTVNVIEINDNTPMSLRSWPDTPEGNTAAEALFTTCFRENKCDECDEQTLEEALEGGSAYNDTYNVYMVHSDTP